MDARSYADRMCANYLTNLLFCQPLFPDSLLEEQDLDRIRASYARLAARARADLGQGQPDTGIPEVDNDATA